MECSGSELKTVDNLFWRAHSIILCGFRISTVAIFESGKGKFVVGFERDSDQNGDVKRPINAVISY